MRCPYGLRLIDPMKMMKVDFDPRVVAVSQSRINRWCGNGLFPVSDAQHSYLLSLVVPPRLRFAALMHDVPEIWTGDIAGPVMVAMAPAVDAYQKQILRRLAGMFFYPYEAFDELHPYDKAIAYDEKLALFPQDPTDLSKCLGVPVEPCSAERAALLWYTRFHELVDDDGFAIQFGQASNGAGASFAGSIHSGGPVLRR